MYLGDNILKEGISKHAEDFRKGNFDARIMLMEVDNPREFGVAELSEDGNVKRLVEKPKKVDDSVVMEGARIIDAGDIVDSIIGRDVIIEKNNKLPKGNKFIIGDNALVRI